MAGARQTILYIEDDPASRMLVERTLRFAGYEVLVADCGLKGIDMARQMQPDMVLTDINLPDISGREVTTMLRSDSRFDQTPIVALTAQAMEEQREMTMAAGISGYLTKPVDVEALPGHIAHYLKGHRDQIDQTRMADAQTRYAQEIVARLEARIRELEDHNEALSRLDKMKDSFIQLTAHELRTPLTLVYGYSRLLEDSEPIRKLTADDESLKTLMGGLVESIQRMQNIINEIVMISRIMTNQIDLSLAAVTPLRVAQKVTANQQNALNQRGLNLHLEETGWPDKVRADADLLALALGNLLNNAIKYTPDGGDIYLSAQVDDQWLVISVRDTGIGVAVEEQERIFERFHTAGDTLLHSTSKTAFRGGGLGLGLAICKAVVDAHGGKVWVESPGLDPETRPGSTFIMRLPLTAVGSKR